jgi:hypothetical protein
MKQGWVTPLAALALSGCLASKSDMLILQSQLQAMQATSARSDTARRFC